MTSLRSLSFLRATCLSSIALALCGCMGLGALGMPRGTANVQVHASSTAGANASASASVTPPTAGAELLGAALEVGALAVAVGNAANDASMSAHVTSDAQGDASVVSRGADVNGGGAGGFSGGAAAGAGGAAGSANGSGGGAGAVASAAGNTSGGAGASASGGARASASGGASGGAGASASGGAGASASGGASGGAGASASGGAGASASGGVTVTGRGHGLGAIAGAGITLDGHIVALAELAPLASFDVTAGADASARFAADAAIEASASLEHDQLPFSGGDTHVVVQLRGAAPSGSASLTGRAPLRVHLVVDRSASMRSSWPNVLDAVRVLISRLGTSDELQIVAYGTDAVEVLPPSLVGDGSVALRALGAIRPHGGTNIEAGLSLAYGAVRTTGTGGSLVILVSDGVPNGGASDAADFGVMARRARAHGACTTSVVGLGNEFDAGILSAIAHEGRGTFHVSPTPAELGAQIGAELAAQGRTAARDVSVVVRLGAGIRITGSVAAGIEQSLDGARIVLPRLAVGESRTVVIPVHVDGGASARAVATVDVGWQGAFAAAPSRASKDLSISLGERAVARASAPSALAVLDADLGAVLGTAGDAVRNGDATTAVAVLRAHVRRAQGRVELRADARLRERTDRIARLAGAIESMAPSASWTDRRVLGVAMVGLSVGFGG